MDFSRNRRDSGRLLPFVRRSLWVTLLLAMANGAFLYFAPSRAETDYAWPIRPPLSAAFMGAGYLSGMISVGLSLFVARYWRSLRMLVWPFFFFGLALLLTTLMHRDRFRWDYPPTWLWTAVYVVIPLWMLLVWTQQQRSREPDPPPDPRLRIIRTPSWVLGAVSAFVGTALLLVPGAFQRVWPWSLTPLLGRVFGSWYLLMCLTLLSGAAAFRQVHEVPVPYSSIAVWSVLALLAAILNVGSLRPESSGYWPWLVFHTVLSGICGWAALYAWHWMRREGQRL